MSDFTPRELYEWCRIPYQELASHPARKIPFRLCQDSYEKAVGLGEGRSPYPKPTAKS
ncbi:MAG: hypothetical protein ACUVWR_17140 [Anaerolineae bacterium]